MSKPKRGSNAKKIDGWRGTCPLCKSERVKLLWIKSDANNVQQKVCKRCGA